MPKELQNVNALYFIIGSLENSLNTSGFSPFAFHTFRDFKAAYEADSDPHDGDASLVSVAYLATLIPFSFVVPSGRSIDIIDPENIRGGAVTLAKQAGYAASSFNTAIDLTTTIGALVVDMVAA